MNLFDIEDLNLKDEVFNDLLKSENVRIERIVSNGQKSPDDFWYNQDQNEWVIVLQGSAILQMENGKKHTLTTGDYINLPAHTKHRVDYTEQTTIWLAVFY